MNNDQYIVHNVSHVSKPYAVVPTPEDAEKVIEFLETRDISNGAYGTAYTYTQTRFYLNAETAIEALKEGKS